jgi:fluoride exporter
VTTAIVWTLVPLLGGAGAIARFLLDGATQRRVDTEFPLGTFVVNMLGTFVLGLATGAGIAGTALLLLGTATLGSFTTFSTWMLESERLGEDGEVRLMSLDLALSLVAGFATAVCGWAIGRAL